MTTKYPRALRDKSHEAIKPDNVYNLLRNVLRRHSTEQYGFPPIESDSAAANSLKWEKKSDRSALVDKILRVCLQSKDVFIKGPRVVKCCSPLYVFGDIHGNFKDLMIYDQLLAKMAPTGYTANCLYLGDYVDRGDSSVECILYLLCMKGLMPNKVSKV